MNPASSPSSGALLLSGDEGETRSSLHTPFPPVGGEGLDLEDLARRLEEHRGRPDELERLREVAEAWVLQVNQGTLGSSVPLLDVLQEALDRSPLLPSERREVLSEAMQRLSGEALSVAAQQSHSRPHLRELLLRLPPLGVERLLAELRQEGSRVRRRFLLEMLLVHGEPARLRALSLLQSRTGPWYFRRNLVHLLRKIHCTEGATREELDLVVAELEAETTQQRREALRYLGDDPRPSAKAALVRKLDRLDRSSEGETERTFVLEQLARQSCPNARSTALSHLLERRRWNADHLRLLKLLGQRDLPAPEVEALVREARELLFTLRLGRLAGSTRQVRLEGLLHALGSSSGKALDELFAKLRERKLPNRVASALREVLSFRESRADGFGSFEV